MKATYYFVPIGQTTCQLADAASCSSNDTGQPQSSIANRARARSRAVLRLGFAKKKFGERGRLMGPTTREIGGAKVICFTPIDERHRPTGNCKQIVAGVLQGPAAGLAICQYQGEDCYYLFGCNVGWQSVTDTWHQTIEEAKAQAEFEYGGVSATWQQHAEPERCT